MTSIMRQKDIRPAPARIEYKGMKFLITDRPSDTNIQNYIVVSLQIIFHNNLNHNQMNSYHVVYFITGIKEK